ncbi:MAG: hypothetical protein AAF617_16870 [Bacteroidota bacterium]
MRKQKIKKLGINKSKISQLTQNLLQGGGTHTCHGHSCCPTETPTCLNTCSPGCVPSIGCIGGQTTACPFDQVP